MLKQDLSQNAVLNKLYDSVSCLHALEHFGLGRYGDKINYNGWKYGLQNLASFLKINGLLYLSVPLEDKNQILFNANQKFHPQTIISFCKKINLKLEDFSLLSPNKVIEPKNKIIKSYANSTGFFTFKKIH